MSFVKLNNLAAQLIALAGFVLLLTTTNVAAQSDDGLEYKIKTAYLYNFTKFIEWPANNRSSFNLCVIGNTQLKPFLGSLENKTALDKPIKVHYFDSPQQISECDIAYFEQLGSLSPNGMKEMFRAPQLNKALTVGSPEHFAESGGMIGFVLSQEKLKLHINLQAIKQQGLSISAKLIEVATLVRGGDDE